MPKKDERKVLNIIPIPDVSLMFDQKDLERYKRSQTIDSTSPIMDYELPSLQNVLEELALALSVEGISMPEIYLDRDGYRKFFGKYLTQTKQDMGGVPPKEMSFMTNSGIIKVKQK